eukprot:CAMPEP_0194512900 /NCGR_PEP_ID=MMETSP0253-20130528/45048_1 /TAXON_ID=2966 /ORGANISM="Noctiluca scintillans" /LENGTH=55 /DNA_ID=CAMNT_0039356409 /DNA_START=145 /DNA_END=313 /DNA_ORIENTATION=-
MGEKTHVPRGGAHHVVRFMVPDVLLQHGHRVALRQDDASRTFREVGIRLKVTRAG